MERHDGISTRAWVIAGAGVIAVTAAVLAAMGRSLICECGQVKLWHGVVHSSENSQHISDWYTFSHVIHGFILYFITWLVFRNLPTAGRGMIALIVEAAWEVLENTPMVINRYREATIALDYYGDSVLNSTFDILFMLAGFAIARRFPVWLTVAIAVGLEAVAAYFIRDNLLLNIIMLVYPLDAVRAWQGGG